MVTQPDETQATVSDEADEEETAPQDGDDTPADTEESAPQAANTTAGEEQIAPQDDDTPADEDAPPEDSALAAALKSASEAAEQPAPARTVPDIDSILPPVQSTAEPTGDVDSILPPVQQEADRPPGDVDVLLPPVPPKIDKDEPSAETILPPVQPKPKEVKEVDEDEERSDIPTEEEAFQEGRVWYIIHTYSGHENKVKTNLEHRTASMDAQDLIFRVVVPTEDEIEIREGQRRTVSRKIFPGYILVQMVELREDDANSTQAWFVVRNTPGVTGFVGSGTRPVPLEQEEVRRILRQMRVEEPRIKVGFAVGQNVRIVDGPFQDFVGQVDDLNLEKGKVKVLVSFFGRETPVELDFLQVEKL